jgi:Holliday junction resolvase-like predicted endonuclease
LGKRGEKRAIGYLATFSIKTIERNARTPFGEIDIAEKDETKLYFIEVKTHANRKFGSPCRGDNKNKS